MPVFTIPYNRTLIDQLRNGTRPRPNNVPVPAVINATAPNNVVPFLNSTILPTATQTIGPLFPNGTNPTATSYATGLGTGTARPTISGFPIGITNLTENATAQAYPYPGAYPYNSAVDGTLYKRAPMPPLQPHIPSYLALAHQDQEPTTGRLNALGGAVHAWVKRAGEGVGVQTGNKGPPPNDVQTHLGIFFCSLAGFFVLLGVGWYVATTVRPRAAPAEENAHTHYVIREKTNRAGGRPWYTRFGFKRYDEPVAYAGHVGGFNDANTVEEGGLRAAMGGNWNSDAGRGSWETQRTAPPAYGGDGGVAGEERLRGKEGGAKGRFV